MPPAEYIKDVLCVVEENKAQWRVADHVFIHSTSCAFLVIHPYQSVPSTVST